MAADRAEHGDGLGPQLEHDAQALECAVKFPLAQRVGDLKDDRLERRLHNGVDVRADDVVRPGIGADLCDLGIEPCHGRAAALQQVAAERRRNILFLRTEVPHDPRREVALGLVGEFCQHGVLFHGIPELFLPLVRLEVRIDEYKAGIVRDVGKQRRQLRAVILRQGEQIDVVDLDHRALRHHRQGLEALREDLHRKILRCQAVEVEVLRRPVDELPAQHGKIVAAKIVLLAVEHIEAAGRLLRQIALQARIAAGFRFFCHSLTS